MKILIIEDDELIAKVYSDKYRSAGFRTEVAADGAHGLELISKFKPDLVHLDLSIPKVDGAEVIRRIRAQPGLASLPVVVLSNTYQNRLVKQAFAAGASQCISKATCTPRMMLEIVERYRAQMPPAPPEVVTTPAVEAPASSIAAPAAAPLTAETPYTTEIHKHAAFQAEIQRGFLLRAPRKLATLRALVVPISERDDHARSKDVARLCRLAHSLAGQAGIAGFRDMAQFASALVAMLREIMEDPKSLTPSAVHTLVRAIDRLFILLDRAADPEADTPGPGVVLVVDDDPSERQAVCQALAGLDVATLSVDDAGAALRLLAENRFRLVVLDISMPGMDGLELCRELRKLPLHEKTPVLFVSGLADEETRAKAEASGGSELVAKPFLPMELALQALTFLR